MVNFPFFWKRNPAPVADDKTHSVMTLRVLGYEEDGGWAAHCLETDLVGRGPTWEVALRELEELTEEQINFAHFKGQPALLNHPAPIHIFEIYTRLAESYLQNFLEPPPDRTRMIGSLPLGPNWGRSGEFSLAGA